MKKKKIILAVSAAAALGLASLLSSCGSSSHESPREAVALSAADVGDVVVFGDIRWYVTAKTETGYTLLSEKPVIKLPFDGEFQKSDTTWDNSTLRAWLNEKFYNTFTEEEKALIEKTHNINPDNNEYGTSGGNDTDDHIFLLSVDEAKALDNEMRKCGRWYSVRNQWWWLRSPGANSRYAAYVGKGGNIDKGGEGDIDCAGDVVSNTYGAVRPALNLRFEDNTVPTAMNRTPSEEESELAAIADSEVGDVVAFGRYTWYVTDKTDGICTLLCQGCVANMAYNDSKTDITWENCSLRRWLNEGFYNSKFSDGEKDAIVTTHNIFTEEDTPYEMDCGKDTDDNVYLFTYSESKTVSDDIRGCGIDWWLRSPGKRQKEAVYVFSGDSWNLMGNDVDHSMGVRPVIRVSYSEHTADTE